MTKTTMMEVNMLVSHCLHRRQRMIHLTVLPEGGGKYGRDCRLIARMPEDDK
jgi:hypothetical protein